MRKPNIKAAWRRFQAWKMPEDKRKALVFLSATLVGTLNQIVRPEWEGTICHIFMIGLASHMTVTHFIAHKISKDKDLQKLAEEADKATIRYLIELDKAGLLFDHLGHVTEPSLTMDLKRLHRLAKEAIALRRPQPLLAERKKANDYTVN